MAEIKIQMLSLEEIKPYEKNPRRNDKAADAVAKSIAEFGWKSPIIVDRDYVIIAGHTRRLAAIKLGLAKVPVYVAEDLTEQQVAAFRLADNRVAEIATWNEQMLREEIRNIKMVDLSEFGFNVDLLDEVKQETTGVKVHVCPRCGAEWTV